MKYPVLTSILEAAQDVSGLTEVFNRLNAKLFKNELPEVTFKILNHTAPNWLGQFIHQYKMDRRTGMFISSTLTIQVQKSILQNQDTLDRVMAHEMVHLWQHVSGHPVEHDANFRKKAAEINSIMGKDFVTEKSDSSYSKEQKPFYVVIWPSPLSPTGYLYTYAPKPLRKVHKELMGSREDTRYMETQDSYWISPKSITARGGYYKKDADGPQRMKELYEQALSLDSSFPRPLRMSDIKTSASLLDKVLATNPLDDARKTKKIKKEEPLFYQFEKEVYNNLQSVYRGAEVTKDYFKHRSGHAYNILHMRLNLYLDRFGSPDWFYFIGTGAVIHAVYAQVGKDLIQLWNRGNILSEYPWKRFEQQAHNLGYKMLDFRQGKLEPNRGYWLQEKPE